MNIMHLMRTYGTHGGEQQLSQLFSIKDNWSNKEFFVDLYNDKNFRKLINKRAPHLKVFNLLNFEIHTKNRWKEFFLVIILFPYLFIKLLILIERQKPSLCISHGFQAGVLFWPFAFISRKITWIYMHRVNKQKKLKYIFKLLYFPAKLVIGNSISVSNSLRYFCSDQKIETLVNGINIKEFNKRSKQNLNYSNKDNSTIKIVCVGRLLPYKGHITILKSIKLILKNHKVTLFVAGDGVLRSKIINKIRQLKLQKNVILLGNIDNVPSLLSEMDIFVNGSLWEGMSNAVLEAMCSGLPSVVVYAPCVTECHQNFKTGFVINNDPQLMADKVSQLIISKNLRRKMGQLAMKRIEKKFSMTHNRNQFKYIYKSMT